MSNFSEYLNLPAEDLQNVADAYEGYANILASQDKGGNKIKVANSFLVAALHRLIIDPTGSKTLFYQAGKLYKELDHPIWHICSICAQRIYRKNKGRLSESGFLNQKNEQFYRFLQEVFFEKVTDTIIPKESTDLRQGLSGKVDVLNIPFSLIEDAISESTYWSKDNKYGHLRRFEDLMSRLNELTVAVKADIYHWNQLQGNVLPFDPLSVAIVVLLVKKWNSHNSFQDLMARLEIPDESVALLMIANELLEKREKQSL
jgi:hypothetical protein